MYSSIDDGVHDKYDVDSARKKMQRNTIAQEGGGNSVELWHAALGAIASSRKMFLIAPQTGNFAAPEWSSASAGESGIRNALDEELSGSVDSLASYDNIRRSEESLVHKGMSSSMDDYQNRMSYAATLMTNSSHFNEDPGLAITDITNTRAVPSIQTNFKALSLRGGGAVDALPQASDTTPTNDQQSNFYTLDGPIELDDTVNRYLKYQSKRLSELRDSHDGASDGYRDISLKCQLPLPVCLEVLGYTMDAHDLNILNGDQQRTSFAWGQKRETLREELEWRKKDESWQILMLLGGVECVEY